MLDLSRRNFFKGMGLLIAAPAIVRIESLMPVKALVPDLRARLPNDYAVKFVEYWRNRVSVARFTDEEWRQRAQQQMRLIAKGIEWPVDFAPLKLQVA